MMIKKQDSGSIDLERIDTVRFFYPSFFIYFAMHVNFRDPRTSTMLSTYLIFTSLYLHLRSPLIAGHMRPINDMM